MNSLKVINFGRCILQQQNRSFTVSAAQNNKKIAVVLSGCGVYDGTEIVEAASTLIHLSKHNANVSFFAPNIEQMHVINHLDGNIQPETRNVLVESARITRGNIKPLEKLVPSDYEALIIPGGFGAAKNLSNYAINNSEYNVIKDVEKICLSFRAGLKPIGFCCIAPVIAAKCLPGCEITVGKVPNALKEWPYGGTVENLKSLGAIVVEKDVGEIHVDETNKIVTTPAFMKNASFFEVFEGIGKMIDEVLRRIK